MWCSRSEMNINFHRDSGSEKLLFTKVNAQSMLFMWGEILCTCHSLRARCRVAVSYRLAVSLWEKPVLWCSVCSHILTGLIKKVFGTKNSEGTDGVVKINRLNVIIQADPFHPSWGAAGQTLCIVGEGRYAASNTVWLRCHLTFCSYTNLQIASTVVATDRWPQSRRTPTGNWRQNNQTPVYYICFQRRLVATRHTSPPVRHM